jgi:hypothetical protein
MSSKDYLKHIVSNTPPASSNAGDEYFAPATNTLYKRVVYSGTNVAWSQIVSTGTDGNITLTGNSISFLTNNKYPIYIGSTTRSTSNSFVGINASGFRDGGVGQNQGLNTLPIYGTPQPEANVSIYFQPRGYGGISAALPDPTNTGSGDGNPGIYRGAFSVDLQLVRNSASSVASGQFSAILGGYDNSATGSSSVSLAGAGNRVSGMYAASIGGQSNYVDSNYSVILGGNYGASRGIQFYNVLTTSGIAFGSASGGLSFAQGAVMTLAATTNASNPSRVALTTGNNSNGGIYTTAPNRNALFLPNNSLFGFKGTVVAAVLGGSGVGNAAWTFEGSIAKGTTAATTTLLGTPTISVMSADSVALTNNWYIAIDADTVNGCLRVTVKGDTTSSIRWYCRIDTSEVAYGA